MSLQWETWEELTKEKYIILLLKRNKGWSSDEGFPGINYNSEITQNIVHVARYQCSELSLKCLYCLDSVQYITQEKTLSRNLKKK